MRFLLGFFLALTMVSCVHKPVETTPVASDLIFPDGRYQQDVAVLVTIKDQNKDFDFSCIVQKDPEEFKFFGYNSFGISLFKIVEKKGQAIEVESSIAEINKNREFFLRVFNLVKTILSLKKNDPRLKNNTIQLSQQEMNAFVTFLEPDSQGIPLQMTVESAGQYQIKIKTDSYKLKTDTAHH